MMSTGLHLTADEFDQMVDRGAFDHLNRKIELIRGELREMNPAGPLHDGLINYLTRWSVLETAKCNLGVTTQTGLDLSELESRPEPDLMWVDDKRYMDRHPSASEVRLAIEVSYSSLRGDLTEKATLYAEAEITEYWIIDANASCVHVFRQPRGIEYTDRQIINIGETIAPLVAPDALLDVRDLFAR
jgi:Uma2 family endonuclease